MNFEEERALARQIHGANHGATLGSERRLQVGQDPATYNPFGAKQKTAGATTGYVAQAVLPPDYNPPKLQFYDKGLGDCLSISDAQRMVNYLDALQAGYQELHGKAVTKLNPFCEPLPVPQTDECAKECDTRLCNSDYFRILESRLLPRRLHQLLAAICKPST